PARRAKQFLPQVEAGWAHTLDGRAPAFCLHRMTEFKDTQQQLTKFRLRVAAAGLFVFICFGLIGFRFLFLQVWHYSKYSLQADENRISVAPIVPNRGIITDRNGVVLAKNYSAYTLEITPSKLNDTLDNVIDKLATVI